MYIRVKNLREDSDYIPTQFLKKLAKLYGVTTDFLLEMDKE